MKKILAIAAALITLSPSLAFAYTVDFEPNTQPIIGSFTVRFTDVDEANACGGGGRVGWTMQAFITDSTPPDSTGVLEVASNYLEIDSGQPIDFTFIFPDDISTENGYFWLSCSSLNPPDALLGYPDFIFQNMPDADGHPPSNVPLIFQLTPLPNQGAWGVAFMMMRLTGIIAIIIGGVAMFFR